MIITSGKNNKILKVEVGNSTRSKLGCSTLEKHCRAGAEGLWHPNGARLLVGIQEIFIE